MSVAVILTNERVVIWHIWRLITISLNRLRVSSMGRWIGWMCRFMSRIRHMCWVGFMRLISLLSWVRFRCRVGLMRRIGLVRWILLIRLIWHLIVQFGLDVAVERVIVVIIIARPSVDLIKDLVRVGKVVIDKESSRFGFTEVRIRSDVRIVNLDVSVLFHTINHHEEQIVNGDLIHVFVLGVIVVLVIVVIIVTVVILFVASASRVLAVAAGTIAIPAESGTVKNCAKLMIDRVSVVLVKSINLVRMAHSERPNGRSAFVSQWAVGLLHGLAGGVATN